jgi:hypothetical protein
MLEIFYTIVNVTDQNEPSQISIVILKISLMAKELQFTLLPRFNDPFYRLSALAASKQHRPRVTSASKRYWAVVTR